jgi:hypothetical protein
LRSSGWNCAWSLDFSWEQDCESSSGCGAEARAVEMDCPREAFVSGWCGGTALASASADVDAAKGTSAIVGVDVLGAGGGSPSRTTTSPVSASTRAAQRVRTAGSNRTRGNSGGGARGAACASASSPRALYVRRAAGASGGIAVGLRRRAFEGLWHVHARLLHRTQIVKDEKGGGALRAGGTLASKEQRQSGCLQNIT